MRKVHIVVKTLIGERTYTFTNKDLFNKCFIIHCSNIIDMYVKQGDTKISFYKKVSIHE